MKILVIGGAGYIGSHTCIEFLNSGYDVVVLDNLSNSSIKSLNRVSKITKKSLHFIEGDIRDKTVLQKIFSENIMQAVIHFAGLKAVGESCEMPLDYYDNNVYGSIVLFQEMEKAGVKKLVFSSSATVYGDLEKLPLTEDMLLSATTPYGRSKLMIEDICRDLEVSDGITGSNNPWAVALLRYFNPVGSHESGLIGEDPSGIPNNLMPFISQVAVGKLKQLKVFGGDYNTVDGTGVRDYIHVVDLAKGHLKAVQALNNHLTGVTAINLGTGSGQSVLQLVSAFEKPKANPLRNSRKKSRGRSCMLCQCRASKKTIRLGSQARH